MTDDLIKIKLDGNWYVIPKHTILAQDLNKFEWEVL